MITRSKFKIVQRQKQEQFENQRSNQAFAVNSNPRFPAKTADKYTPAPIFEMVPSEDTNFQISRKTAKQLSSANPRIPKISAKPYIAAPIIQMELEKNPDAELPTQFLGPKGKFNQPQPSQTSSTNSDINKEIISGKIDVQQMNALSEPQLAFPSITTTETTNVTPDPITPSTEPQKKQTLLQSWDDKFKKLENDLKGDFYKEWGLMMKEEIKQAKQAVSKIIKDKDISAIPKESRLFIASLMQVNEDQDPQLPDDWKPTSQEKADQLVQRLKDGVFALKQKVGYEGLNKLASAITDVKKQSRPSKLLGQQFFEKFAIKSIDGFKLDNKVQKEGISAINSKEALWTYSFNILLAKPLAKIIHLMYETLYLYCPIIAIIIEIIVGIIWALWRFAKVIIWFFIGCIVPLGIIEFISTHTMKYQTGVFKWFHKIAIFPRVMMNGLFNVVLAVKYFGQKFADSFWQFFNPFTWWEMYKTVSTGGGNVAGSKPLKQPLHFRGWIDPVIAVFSDPSYIQTNAKGYIYRERGYVKLRSELPGEDFTVVYKEDFWEDGDGFFVSLINPTEIARGWNWTYQYGLGQGQWLYNNPAREIIAYFIWIALWKRRGYDLSDPWRYPLQTGLSNNFYLPKFPKCEEVAGIIRPVVEFTKYKNLPGKFFYDIPEHVEQWNKQWFFRYRGESMCVDWTDPILQMLADLAGRILSVKGGHDATNFGPIPANKFQFAWSLIGDGWQENMAAPDVWLNSTGPTRTNQLEDPQEYQFYTVLYQFWDPSKIKYAKPGNLEMDRNLKNKKFKFKSWYQYKDYEPFVNKNIGPWPDIRINARNTAVATLSFVNLNDISGF